MEVRTADHLGMCFGVKDAIDLALRLTKQGPLTILGDLVHNPDVVAEMDAAGAFKPAHAASNPMARTATRVRLIFLNEYAPQRLEM